MQITNNPRPAANSLSILVALVIALLIGYGTFVILSASGISMANKNAGVFNGAAFGYYTAQHIALEGKGDVTDDFGDKSVVSASISLPMMAWGLIPALGFLIGGFVMGKMRAGKGMVSLAISSCIAAFICALIMLVLASFVGGMPNNSILPSVGEIEFSLPQITYHPAATSSLLIGFVFSFIFICIGAFLSLSRCGRSNWWYSFIGSFTALFGIIIFFAIALMGYYFASLSRDDVGPVRFAQMVPTVTNLLYSASFGSDLSLSLTTKMGSQKPHKMFDYNINLYKKNKDIDKIPVYAYILPLLIGVSIAFAGWLGAKLGSNEPVALMALRNTCFTIGFVAFMMIFTSIHLDISDPISHSVAHITASTSYIMILSVIVIYMLSYIGAIIGAKTATTLENAWK